MRLWGAALGGAALSLALGSVAAAQPASPSPQAAPACETSLAAVFAAPLKYTGVRFCGEAYFFHGGFYPKPIAADDNDVVEHGTVLMTANRTETNKLTAGDRVFLRGDLKPFRPCFTGEKCEPWTGLITLENFQFEVRGR
jgi:hypothetical protein